MTIPTSEYYPIQSALTLAEEPAPFFSRGAAVGSYNPNTFLWTPGRDASGIITQRSFDLVPVGPWVEVAQTAFVKKVQPLLSAALPTYNDSGASDLADVLDDYSGFAHDAEGGRVFAHGGGHHERYLAVDGQSAQRLGSLCRGGLSQGAQLVPVRSADIQ